MAHPVLSVCIFCLICATHSPCGSHAAVNHESPHVYESSASNELQNSPLMKNLESPSRAKIKPDATTDDQSNIKNNETHLHWHVVRKRNSIEPATQENYISKIFKTFGDGNSMTIQGFEKFIEKLDLLQVLSTKLDSSARNSNGNNDNTKPQKIENDESCIDKKQIFSSLNITEDENARLDETVLKEACPAILYSLMVGRCNEELHVHEDHEHHVDEENSTPSTSSSVWIYSTAAVVLTSACGILALVIIPVMQKKFYKPLLQFLVALAVGTLAGDAFLHLLPHAMTKAHTHNHQHNQNLFLEEVSGSGMDPHDENMWKGFVAMLGLTFFFFMERVILLAGKWRKARHKKMEPHSHMKFIPNGLDDLNETNPTQCMDRYNSYPYCYQDIINNHQLHGCSIENDKSASTMLDDNDTTSEISSLKKSKCSTVEKIESDTPSNNGIADNVYACTEVNKMLPAEKAPKSDNITIILREHASAHHGHSHSHGHVHAAPQNFSSVAWMVIMGDGLHNFTDGMAIGAAFSTSLAGGFSTAVAVFCHELPHELGDFAMLLKAGMTIRQALLYNMLSSVLSILGNVAGICLGNTEYASSWVFAAAAGMFIYIALVDMIPELSSSHEDESNLTQCCLHFSGLVIGFGIMTVIAMYEQDLKTIFKEPV